MGGQLAAQNKRKEKARIAARARRSQEASIIMEMANELHITQEKIRRIDKATIVKLAIDYIKAFDILCRIQRNCNNCSSINTNIKTDSTTSSDTMINTNELLLNKQQVQAPQTVQRAAQQHEEEDDEKEEKDDQLDVRQQKEQQQHIQHQKPHTEFAEQIPLFPAPKLNTLSIFAPRTEDMDSHFLMINKLEDGRAAFILKPDEEVLDEDDLTHLAPQAGDSSIALDVEPLEGIVLDKTELGALFIEPNEQQQQQQQQNEQQQEEEEDDDGNEDDDDDDDEVGGEEENSSPLVSPTCLLVSSQKLPTKKSLVALDARQMLAYPRHQRKLQLCDNLIDTCYISNLEVGTVD